MQVASSNLINGPGAMQGTNRFRGLKTTLAGKTSASCVFISYRHVDRATATSLAEYFRGHGTDIYFDNDDPALEDAVARGDDEAIVHFVEQGICESTHLLGIISPVTRDSWWVPFEIGSARRLQLSIAYVLVNHVDDLPSYLNIATLLEDMSALDNWAHALGEPSLAWRAKELRRLARGLFEDEETITGLPAQRREPARFRRR